ncbi:ABC transporter substrate-binding protein [Paenibacillus sp. GSMTC-2017]|uniref:ABC transporter substrate-binding protein n=1 Tax=Paenibacillus sp. GSMTC-2017 TaxID=2794350 RepID=UPI001E430563|nr:ABC transporter substrate-binding protein [Paenibacillus sp. GSMTC-2017]
MSSIEFNEIRQPVHSFYMPVRIMGLDNDRLGNDRVVKQSFHRILIVWSGDGLLFVNEEQHEVARGSVFLCDAASQLELKLKSRSPLKGVLIEYCNLNIDGYQSSILKYPVPLQRCSLGILRLAGELENVWREPELSGPFRSQQLFIELLTELYQFILTKQQPSKDWLNEVCSYMENHYNEDLTREQLAELASVSPEHLSRTFRKHTGRTFNAYLTLIRIRNAQSRILTGAPDLNTLAHEVGYKEGFYLSRKFKETVGLSPTAYRRADKRIVSLNLNHTASLIALGVVPELGVYTSWLEQVMQRDNMIIGKKFNPYGHTASTYYDGIVAVNPDVIISYIKEEENKSLLPIAPVLELPFMTMSWREQFHMIAHIVNKQQQAEVWLENYDAQVVKGNNRLDQTLGSRGTAIVWEIGQHKAYCFNNSHGRGSQVLYDDLGFRLPSELLDQGIATSGYIEVDFESMANYSATHIFITAMPTSPEGQERINRLFRSANWLKLEAVNHNRVYLLNEDEVFWGYDPISSQAQLQVLLQALIPDHKFA